MRNVVDCSASIGTSNASRCGKIYGRHSNSLDVEKKCCGVCRGLLTSLGRFNKDGTPAKVRYLLFLLRPISQSILAAAAYLRACHAASVIGMRCVCMVVLNHVLAMQAASMSSAPRCNSSNVCFLLMETVSAQFCLCRTQRRQATGFSSFVKEHFEATRNACGGAGTPHKTVMGRLAQQWAQHKATVAMGSLNISDQNSSVT